MNILYVNFLSGIKIGDIGTKLGMKTYNNGFLALENVRIPREQMLMKNSKVLEVSNTYLSAILSTFIFNFNFQTNVKLTELSWYILRFERIAIGDSNVFLVVILSINPSTPASAPTTDL